MGNTTRNYQTGNTDSGVAESDIEAFRFVKYGTAPGTVIPCTAITDIAVGVSLEKTPSGSQCTYQTRGIAMVETSAAVTINTQVMPTAAGAGKASTAAGATARSAGVAQQASGDDAQIIPVAINLPNLNGPANA